MSRSLPNFQDDEFREDSVDALALLTSAELEDRLRSIQYKKRSRSSTVTLQNMYEREPGHSDNDISESDDEEVQYQTQSSESSKRNPRNPNISWSTVRTKFDQNWPASGLGQKFGQIGAKPGNPIRTNGLEVCNASDVCSDTAVTRMAAIDASQTHLDL